MIASGARASAAAVVTLIALSVPAMSGTDKDPRTYPISSYTYAIIPTGASDATMTTAKRQTLTDFLTYSICSGQREAGQVGYAPSPLNLVRAGFAQIRRLHDADPGLDVSNVDAQHCNNPTFSKDSTDTLGAIAPQPAPCDHVAPNPCTPVSASRLQAPPRTTVSRSAVRRTLLTRLTDSGTGRSRRG